MTDLDHRYMTPPFLRRVSTFSSPEGSTAVWHLRIAQPNVSHIAMPTVHSMEHFLGDHMQASSPVIRLVAPMGCQTGYYIVAVGTADFDDMAALLEDALKATIASVEVPHANTRDCGWAEHHSLAGAHDLAAWLLSRRADWSAATLHADEDCGHPASGNDILLSRQRTEEA
jgi:S-ribosylhomocysteine lyase